MNKISKIAKKDLLLQMILVSHFKILSWGIYDAATFSFYYSHQQYSEGGMVTCNNQRDYETLHAHTWLGRDKLLQKRYMRIRI